MPTQENKIAFLLHTLSATCPEWYDAIVGDPNDLSELLAELELDQSWVNRINKDIVKAIQDYGPEYAAVREVIRLRCDNSCWRSTCAMMAQQIIEAILAPPDDNE